MLIVVFCFFFFKTKTAYELRISDWSSDVCSSDLLIEAELFGHEKGAFTGATSRNAGRFEQAAGGTLFLDEIGDMPLEAQTRLLRVLQTSEYSTVGGSQALRADVRVIAAT